MQHLPPDSCCAALCVILCEMSCVILCETSCVISLCVMHMCSVQLLREFACACLDMADESAGGQQAPGSARSVQWTGGSGAQQGPLGTGSTAGQVFALGPKERALLQELRAA